MKPLNWFQRWRAQRQFNRTRDRDMLISAIERAGAVQADAIMLGLNTVALALPSAAKIDLLLDKLEAMAEALRK